VSDSSNSGTPKRTTPEAPEDDGVSRRRLLSVTGLSGLAALAGCPGGESSVDVDTDTETGSSATSTATGTETATIPTTETRTETATAETGSRFGTGPPRFLQVGERLMDPIFTDAGHGFDRDNLAPRIVDPERDPDSYAAETATWSVAERPDGSEAEIVHAPTPFDDVAQYDHGTHNTAEFSPDVPGRYVLELEVDPPGDGETDKETHRQTVHAFPPAPAGAGGPPSLELDGEVVDGVYVLTPDTSLAPDSDAAPGDVEVVYLPADGAGPSGDDVDVDDATHAARIPVEAVEEPTSVYAAAFDGKRHSVTDEVRLYPAPGSDADADRDEPAVELPNRPPDWLDDAVVYEIFTRSFAGAPGETDFEFLADKAEYLGELGVDVVWLTPVVPAWSATIEAETDRHAPGGPHGYSTADYFDVADDLGTLREYEAFVDACHEQGVKVCFDLVANHCGWTNPKFQDVIASTGDGFEDFWRFPEIAGWNRDSNYFDWFDRMDGATGLDAAPAQTSFFGVRLQPNLNYGNLAVREHLLAAVDFWSDTVDGFRCDIAWGVPHSFWKEVRDLVKDKDPDFLLLDETVPNDPSFAASEFDLHFDTKEFMGTVTDVAAGRADAESLLTAVRKRTNEGFPGRTRVINSTENHDESRLYVEVEESGAREDPAHSQRAAAAAVFTLPGVPFIYYGQERLISEYGHRRESPFADRPDLSDDIERNPYARGFVNWAENGDTVPSDHLQFYSDLVDFYHESPALAPDAELVREYHRTDSGDVLVFGLGASEADEAGENEREHRVVVVNFAAEPRTVHLRSVVDTTDRFTGEDLATRKGDEKTDEESVAVEVDTLAVFETPSLLGLGERVIGLDEPAGDDHGPGGYTYPTTDAVADGTFDLTRFVVRETADSYQFQVGFDGPVENPWGYQGGISVQHLQCYLRHPTALWGQKEARTGVGVTFEERYQYRVVVDGQNGVRLETASGEHKADGSLGVTPDGDLVVEFPKDPLLYDISSMLVAPFSLGYDPDAPGNVMRVEPEAGERAFGGGSETGPNVIDVVTPEDVTQETALSPADGDGPVSPPFTPLRTSFDRVASWSDPAGDDHGPGGYTYPTNDAFYDGAFDLTGVTVGESRERLQFRFEFASPVQNPWGLPRGFSHQFFQVYVRDPEATDGQPASTTGRSGTNLTFEAPYHYRIAVNGEGTARVEKPDDEQTFGATVTNDVVVSFADERTVQFEFPKGAVGGSLDGTRLAVVVAPYDGFGDGGLRAIGESKAEYVIGGGSTDDVEPVVMDMVTPEGVRQFEALAYGPDERATLPYLSFDAAGGDGRGDGAGDEDGR